MAAHSFVDPPTLTNHVGPDDACASATEFLLDHLGNHVMAGEPHLMVSAVRAVWIVPVQLAYLHSGTLGSVGVVAVDEQLSHPLHPPLTSDPDHFPASGTA
jgi:hypothetical protein